MIKRAVLTCLALLAPVGIAILIACVALPGVLPIPGISSTAIATRVEQKPSHIPQTLEDAKRLTADRLAHLRSLTQTQWEEERKSVLYRDPPPTIEAAIERAQWRIRDLNAMSEEDWELEKQRLLARNKELATR